MISKKLFTTKYRPKKIEGVILLPRIKNELFNSEGQLELNGNYLFVGTPGIGKSTLAKAIIPENALTVNASINSSVEDLKDTVSEYCKTSDIFGNSSIDGYKMVYLDEFDGVSQKYQEGLRSFIEEKENHVRFIATCNNISKLSDAILSRFTVIKFDPVNEEERKYLLNEYFGRCSYIKGKNNIDISDDDLKSVIKLNFPDLRSVYNTLQRSSNSGYTSKLNISHNKDLFEIIFNNSTTEETYNWVIQNYGDHVEQLLKLCGRPLVEYILEHKQDKISIVPRLLKITSKHLVELSMTPDPLVLVVSCIFEIKQIINK